jgi:hypothetical protein
MEDDEGEGLGMSLLGLPLPNGDVSLDGIDRSDLDVEAFRVGSVDLESFRLEPVVRPLVYRLLL